MLKLFIYFYIMKIIFFLIECQYYILMKQKDKFLFVKMFL